ncbi:MAG: nucleotidyltransferase domain-containing protein, partial [Methanobacteriota archaeon]
MEAQGLPLPEHHRRFLDHFAAVCHADVRVVAAFLGGSYAKGLADAFSDLDLTVITTDSTYEQFVAGRESFIRQLGEPLFIEDFERPNMVFMIFSDGTEAELWFASPSRLKHIHSGPFHTLVDKAGILAAAEFPPSGADSAWQTETLRRLITWFWHDMAHHICPRPMAVMKWDMS